MRTQNNPGVDDDQGAPRGTRRGVDGDDARRIAALLAGFDRHRRVLGQRATLGTADLRLLWLFTDGRSRTLRQIAHALGLEQSTVNRQVNVAVKEGLLERHRDSGSAPYVFTPSPRGSREFEGNVTTTLDAYRAALDSLGPGREQFLELMATFVDVYGQHIAALDADEG